MESRGVLILIVCILLASIVYSLNFYDLLESDFSGIFNNTFYNSSGFIQVGDLSFNNSSEKTEMTGIESGLISYWRMNESSWSGSSGEVKDVLGVNNGTAVNGATTASGLFGNAGSFDGVNDYINLGNSNSVRITGNITVSAWIKFNLIPSGTNGDSILCKNEGGGYGILANEASDGRLQTYFYIGGSYKNSGVSLSSLSAGNWYYVVATYNGTSVDFYLNGVKQQSVSATGSISDLSTINLTIGANPAPTAPAYTNFFNGTIDEIAVWDVALSSSEILTLYQKGTNSSQSQPTSGTYESEVKDAGAIVNWTNISWNGLNQSEQGTGVATEQGNIFLSYLEGNAADENGINNGILKNNPSSVPGKNDLGYQLNGVNQYIEIPDSNSLDLTSSFSVGAWVNLSSLPSGVNEWRGIITKGGPGDGAGADHNYFLALDNAVWGSGVGITFGYENSAGANFDTRYQIDSSYLNRWVHLVGVFNDSANTMTLYINGTQASQDTDATATPVTQSEPVFIGRNMNGSSSIYYFNGIIDDVFISNYSLSSTEIQEIYSSTSSSSNLQFQFKTSNDNSSWSSYTSLYNSPSSLNLSNSRYIQYKTYFVNSLARLYNVTILYNLVPDLTVSLDSPADNYLTNSFTLFANCSASSNSTLVNATLYHDFTGWQAHATNLISGTSNSTSFSFIDVTTGTHKWNCYFCDLNGICSFANSNKTIIVDNLAPTIDLVSPNEESNENTSSTINFAFNSTDERATALQCSLLIDDLEVASNSSTLSGVNTILSALFSNGDYTWKINCSDGVNSEISEERNLTVNISDIYTPFWAKANTHTHTTNSDGDSSPTTVVNLYKSKGYSILAITDHGFITDCSAFTNLSESFICVNSEEWTSTKHVTRINVSSTYNNAAQYLQSAVNAANNEGGFSIAAHPNWSSTIWTVSQLTSLENYTAMEIYNKVIERLSPDPYAVNKWDEVLVAGKKIFGVAADDMHQVSIDLGYGWTKVYMSEFTKQAYIDSMKSGYFYSSQGPNMDQQPFQLDCDGLQTYNMGETANCSSIRVNATISATNSSYSMVNISLIKDGVVINMTTCSSQNCTFDYSQNVSSSGYYRLQARDSYNKWIWSNPIWVNKIATPVVITVHNPSDGSLLSDYTPLLNVSLNQETSLWHSVNGGDNITLCAGCSSHESYLTLKEGNNFITIYSNNSDNIVRSETLNLFLNFNKSLSDLFSDNSSIESTSNLFWSNGKMSMGAGQMFGNFILKPIQPVNNITSFIVRWEGNNTENAVGDGQRVPIILKYQINNSDWVNTDSMGNYITSGIEISGLNGNNLSIMFDFEKNNQTPVDLLSFNITWTEYTVPLIYNTSKLTTSSTATITWETDTSSNSTLEYGESVLLGNVLDNSSLVNSHSITIPNLNQNTVYYYKIKSCTADSCAEYPQSPYPVDSFTTKIVSTPPSGGNTGGSSSGGGGGSATPPIISGLNKLEITKNSIPVFKPGESKKLTFKVRNAGTNFLNDCKLTLVTYYDNLFWLSNSNIEDLSAGEEYDFTFNLKISDVADYGKYDLSLIVGCVETNKSIDFELEVLEEKLIFDFIKIERISEDKVKVVYSLEEILGIEQKASLQFLLLTPSNQRITEFNEDRLIPPNTKQEFETIIPIPSSFEGEIKLLANINSEDYNAFVEEEVILGRKGITGLSVFERIGGVENIISGFLILLFLVFAFFIMRRILKHRKKIKSNRRKHLLWIFD